MTLGAHTPRDQLDRVLALVRRAIRYWWVAGLVCVVGTLLSTALALMRGHQYQSASVIMYQEVISARLLQGASAGGDQGRGMALRFREMAMARPLLEKVIVEQEMYDDLIEADGIGAAIDEMRLRVGFRAGGGGTFVVSFTGDSPDEAQAVAASMATHLIEWEKDLLIERSGKTKDFLDRQRDMVQANLEDREHDLAEFFSENPEFAMDTGAAATGAGVRAAQESGAKPTQRIADPALRALERQRSRIKARLAAAADDGKSPAPAPAAVRREQTPEERQAESELRYIERELDTAQRNLESMQARFTDQHPDVASAKTQVRTIEKNVKAAEAKLRAATAQADKGATKSTAPPPPATKADIAALEEELQEVNRNMVAYRRRQEQSSGSEPKKEDEEVDEGVNKIVLLETEHQRLRREVSELQERKQSVEAKAFTAEMVAASEVATQGAQLVVIEPAFRPSRPAGTPRSMFVIAGMVAFTALGITLSFGCALMDDRIVAKYDIERLELLPVLVVVPMPKKQRKHKSASKSRPATEAQGA